MTQTPDIAGWISAGANVGLLIAAVAAAFYAAGTWRAARAANKDLAEERKREQASKVAAWAISEALGHRVYVRNASLLPVFELLVAVALNPSDEGVTHANYASFVVIPVFEAAVLPPGFDESITVVARDRVRREIEAHGGKPFTYADGDVRIFMSFVDSAGVKWTRWRHGILTEQDPS